jgi:hypothetical protein
VERTPLDSRAIASAGYDEPSRTLELEWRSGRIYQYLDVPPGAYRFFLRAPSKGGFFSRMIDGRYAFREVTPPDPRTQEDLAQALQASLRQTDEPER